MNFQEHLYEGRSIGLSYRSKKSLFFFGNRSANLDVLKKVFNTFAFCQVHQVHGDALVQASSDIPKADALWTDKINQALFIKTADCMPLLLEQGSKILAIHSGWRGTFARILQKSLAAAFNQQDPVEFACGPHIQTNSFEVDLDLAKKFQNEFNELPMFYSPSEQNPEKAFLNLQVPLRAQLSGYDIKAAYYSNQDTLINKSFCSFRREKDKACRNYSFVARLTD